MPNESFGYRADEHPLGIRVLREVAIFLFFLALTAAFTWPLPLRLETTVADLGDPLLNTWILDWDLYSFTSAPAHLFRANIFYPSLYPLAYGENLIGVALAVLPFYLLGFTPLAIHNVALLLGFAFSGYGAFVLGRAMTRSIAAGLVGGILYAFVDFRLDHLGQLPFVWGGWLPMMLASLLHYWRRPTIRNAALFGICVLLNALCSVHLFLFGTTAAVLSIAVAALIFTRFKWRAVIGATAATVIASALMIPVLLPYKKVSERYQMVRDAATVREGSATWTDWLSSSKRSAVYGHVTDPAHVREERALFPGLAALFLTASALLMDRRKLPVALDAAARPRWLLHTLDAVIVVAAMGAYFGSAAVRWHWFVFDRMFISLKSSDLPAAVAVIAVFARLSLQVPPGLAGGTRQSLRTAAARSRVPFELWIAILWIVVGVIGSLGMHAFLHTFLFDRLPMFRGIRMPARWASIAYVGLAATAAAGAAAWIESRRTKAARWAVALLLIAISIHDVMPAIRWTHVIDEVDPVYRWMREAKVGGGTLELPMAEAVSPYLYLFAATSHHLPIFNGASGFEPPLHELLRTMTTEARFNDALVPLLAHNNGRLVIVHDDWLRGANVEATREWLRREIGAGRLAFVRRFDHRTGGDYVFAVVEKVPDWPRLQIPDARDRAAFTEQQELDRMLGGKTTYMTRTFGLLDTPYGSDYVVPPQGLTVKGWALSPHGVAAVDVLIHNGMFRYRAEPASRIDVQMKYPWYPRVHNAGFTLTLPKRPKGVPEQTDVQVEVIDGHGGRTRFPDRLITW